MTSEHVHRFIDPVGSDGLPIFNDPVCAVCGNHPESGDDPTPAVVQAVVIADEPASR